MNCAFFALAKTGIGARRKAKDAPSDNDKRDVSSILITHSKQKGVDKMGLRLRTVFELKKNILFADK